MYIPKIPCIPQATGSGWIIASLVTSDQLWWLPSLNIMGCAHITRIPSGLVHCGGKPQARHLHHWECAYMDLLRIVPAEYVYIHQNGH